MKVLNIDKIKRRIKLIPETSIDLLNIYRLIEPGDIIYSDTTREVKKHRASGNVDSERIKIKIGIEVVKKIVDPFMRRISLLGTIKHTDKEIDVVKKHHTIHLELEKPIEIESRVRFLLILSLAKSTFRRVMHEVLCISIDDEKFAVIHISNSGVKILRTRELSLPVKGILQYQEEDTLSKNVDEVIKVIEEEVESRRKLELILLGPSVIIEKFSKEIKAKRPEIGRLIKRQIRASSGGIDGLLEALRMGSIGRHLKPLEDAFIVEEAIRQISKISEKAKMGLEEVTKALGNGKRGLVLITEDYLWKLLDDERINSILSEAQKGRLELRIILSETEAAEKLDAFGGIVLISR